MSHHIMADGERERTLIIIIASSDPPTQPPKPVHGRMLRPAAEEGEK